MSEVTKGTKVTDILIYLRVRMVKAKRWSGASKQ
jgi:hypothetical protein